MKSKKSQIGQIFIYLISTLIIVLVLYYGYTAIKNIGKKQEQLELVKFQKAIGDTITYTSSDYGTVRIETFTVPVIFREVCFVDYESLIKLNVTEDPAGNPIISQAQYPLIYNSVKDRVRQNVFPLPDGTPFFVEKMWVDPDEKGFVCFDVSQGSIKVRIEGFGDKAKISRP
ncbi:hypothetical protein KY308_00400 [Candidatus Woesearchaeota archaeon]|nr:hypothetical protein [Candidatus Woesearchaeota archaeon]